MKFRSLTTVYILFVLFIPDSIALINKPGIPLLSVSRAYLVVWGIIFLGLLYKRKGIREAARAYPFYKPMSLVLLSMIVVTLFATNVFSSANVMLSFLSESFLLSLMVWVSYREPKQVVVVSRRMVIIFVMLAIYGTVAYLVGVNPVMEFVERYFASDAKRLIFDYSDVERLGTFGRANSIFSHPIQYGALLVIAIWLSVYQTIIGVTRQTRLSYIYIIIMLIGIAFTFSRTPILFLIIIALVFWLLQSIVKKVKLTVFALCIAVAALPFIPDSVFQLISSLFIELLGGESDVRGSSMVMRIEQLVAATVLFIESPVVGHGLASTRIMIESGTLPVGLRQAESELFSILIDAGLVGLLATTYFYFFLGRYFLKQKRVVIAKQYRQITDLAFALLIGYVSFILATGVLGTFQLFLITITMAARYLYLSHQRHLGANLSGEGHQPGSGNTVGGLLQQKELTGDIHS